MKSYFNLHSATELVRGSERAVLYDFSKNKIYQIEPVETKILISISQGTELQSIAEKYGEDKTNVFVSQLKGEGLGNYDSSFIPKETYREGVIESGSLEQTVLSNIYYELPCGCDYACDHCEQMKVNSCLCCKLSGTQQTDWGKITQAILDTFQFVESNIFLHGGNPLSEWDKTKELVSLCSIIKRETQQVYLIAPYGDTDPLFEEKLSFLLKEGIVPIINICVEENSVHNVLDKIMFLEQMTEVNRAQLIVNLLVDYNLLEHDLLAAFADIRGITITKSIILNNEESKFDNRKHYHQNSVNFKNYKNADLFHPCLKGTVAITSQMEILPCPSMKNDVLASYSKRNFKNLFQDYLLLDSYWKMPLKKLKQCGKCEYNRFCLDCRAVEAKGTDEKTKYHCSYN
ncbi:hypothetical protein [Paenibacillus piscarius]|uniref:hypothetical protein n=1 Tax=Paenibacillus piscarius TaxID=1089681 RepID=UPI001EE84AC1|nr:hypothetical protein [Paenibacillus piscarius]